ncbi:MAG: phospholipase D family protein, partial [Gammaproteobacteria bacterium]
PAVLGMRDNFNAFWQSERSVPAPALDDVARVLLDAQADPQRLQLPQRAYSPRMNVMAAMAQDGPRLLATLAPYRRAVGDAVFYADLPEKHADEASSRARASNAVYQVISQAQSSVLLQTPYLVMSRMARQTFRQLKRRERPVQVWVSTK